MRNSFFSFRLLRTRRFLLFLLFLSLLYLRWSPGLESNGPSWRMKANVWSENETLADCKLIIKGDKEEIVRAKSIMKQHPKKPISPDEFIELSKDCDDFKNNRGYIPIALNKREQQFPIAFGIAIYKDIEQFERLLRAIYRPQNYYCVHVDLKSPKVFHQAVERISRCFPNVFMASRFVDVRWGDFTLLEAYLICMKDLLLRFKNWKYFINLTGQEFPLKTNNELVEELRNLSGRSLVSGSRPKRKVIIKRYTHVNKRGRASKTRKTPFRYNFTFFKGSAYVVLSRDYANFSLTSQVAKEFLEWLKDTGNPDETFFPTLFANVNLPIPNVFVETEEIRYVKWDTKVELGEDCRGKNVRWVCVYGTGDLKHLINKPALFLNKFHLDFEYLALDCMEQWMYNKTFDFYSSY